jgi:hypothetical protein
VGKDRSAVRRAAKVDNNHVECVIALRKAGYLVYRQNETALPDLLVNRRGSGRGWLLLEIKSEGGDLTPAQRKWFGDTEGTWRYEVRTPAEAVACANQHLLGGRDGSES